MKIRKLDTISKEQLDEYKNNKYIKRRKILKGGYEHIVFATDEDLD